MVYYPNNRELAIYIQEVGKYPLLTKQKEFELARKIRETQDQDSIDKLVNSNLRFVVYVAKKYQDRGLKLMDLIQEGNTGLKKATKKFDETRGNRFISYAVWWVRQSIERALSEETKTVRLPANKYQLFNRMSKYIDNYLKQHGTNPSDEHLTEVFLRHIGDKKGVLRLFYQSREQEIRLDSEIEGEDNDARTRHELMVMEQDLPSYQVEERELNFIINEELKRLLNPREQRVIYSYFFSDPSLNLQEIGDEFGITRERARQIKNEALGKLRKSKRIASLSDILS
ncbi:RNA polymerase sigma factor RpoD/SigA [Candidatus Woesearchaeota archaeon]|nr:RNA polymerase sigma factor RpoD/SigA [Candidatus Woesearchaeota archaeon]